MSVALRVALSLLCLIAGAAIIVEGTSIPIDLIGVFGLVVGVWLLVSAVMKTRQKPS